MMAILIYQKGHFQEIRAQDLENFLTQQHLSDEERSKIFVALRTAKLGDVLECPQGFLLLIKANQESVKKLINGI